MGHPQKQKPLYVTEAFLWYFFYFFEVTLQEVLTKPDIEVELTL